MALSKLSQPVHLVETDKAIIDHLQTDGRMPYAKLGPLVGLSPAAARQRVLALTASGVLQIVAVTDPISLGFGTQAWVGIAVTGDLDEAADAIASIDETDYVVVTTGRFDVMAEIVAEDNDHLLGVMNLIRSLECVRSTEVFTYMKLVKQTYNWGTR